MELSVNCFSLLSLVQFTCLFLCQTSCKADESDDMGSGSGDFPIVPTPTTVDATSTPQNLLVPFLTDVDALPPSASLYIIPIARSTSLGGSLSSDVLPGITTTVLTTFLPSLSVVSIPPSISPLPLVSYTINLARAVVINQLQVDSVISNITLSLAGALALEPSDIFDVKLLPSPGMIVINKRQSPAGGELITFSAIDFSVRESHVSSVKLLSKKITNGETVAIQLAPNETVLVKEIMRSSSELATATEGTDGSSLSTGQLAGIAVAASLAGVLVLVLIVASVAVVVVKTGRSKESQEIANLRRTYGYHYTSHATSEWPPSSPLL